MPEAALQMVAESSPTLGDIDDMGEIKNTYQFNNNNTTERDEILSELNTLTKTFAEVEASIDDTTQIYEETISSYEYRVSNLEEKNAVCEKDLMELTVVLKKNEKQIQELQQDENVNEKVKDLHGENDMLRQRVRSLELQLSEIAFESRKAVVPSAFAPLKVDTTEASGGTNEEATFMPKAPSSPVPPHIFQQRLREHRQRVVREVEFQLGEATSRKGALPSPLASRRVPTVDIIAKEANPELLVGADMLPKAPIPPLPPHIFLEERKKVMEASDLETHTQVLPSPPAYREPKMDTNEVALSSSINDTKYLPKAPASPVPFKQRQSKQRQRVMGASELQPRKQLLPALSACATPTLESADPLPRSRFKIASKSLDTFVSSSINDTKHLSMSQNNRRRLFGQRIRRGFDKVGKALRIWSPMYNLALWTEMTGQYRQLEELQEQVEKYKYDNERSSHKLFGLSFSRGRSNMRLFEPAPPAFITPKRNGKPPDPAFITPKRNGKESKLAAVASNIYDTNHYLNALSSDEVKEEELSAPPKVLGLSVNRRVGTKGRTLSKWNPLYNLGRWGELRDPTHLPAKQDGFKIGL